jgi:16S rRNA (uracil1498-N3)-methyltransferase
MDELFYVNPANIRDRHVKIGEDEGRHLLRVLRKKIGDHILVTDGRGHRYVAVIRAVAGDEAECEILDRHEDVNEPRMSVTLAVSILKNPGRFDFLVEKATELGVRSIIPMVCERTVRHNEHHDRLVKIAVSAMKQSGRSYLPEIFFKTSLATLIESAEEYDLKLIPHEKTEQSHFIDTVLQHHRDAQSVLVLIGPEGGFTDEELAGASARGFVPISLGPRRLRAETAALSAMCHCVGSW